MSCNQAGAPESNVVYARCQAGQPLPTCHQAGGVKLWGFKPQSPPHPLQKSSIVCPLYIGDQRLSRLVLLVDSTALRSAPLSRWLTMGAKPAQPSVRKVGDLSTLFAERQPLCRSPTALIICYTWQAVWTCQAPLLACHAWTSLPQRTRGLEQNKKVALLPRHAEAGADPVRCLMAAILPQISGSALRHLLRKAQPGAACWHSRHCCAKHCAMP